MAEAIADIGLGAHLIAVSTAYVASTHQGEAKEELLTENRFTLDVPWEDEVDIRPAPARRPAGRFARSPSGCVDSPRRPAPRSGRPVIT